MVGGARERHRRRRVGGWFAGEEGRLGGGRRWAEGGKKGGRGVGGGGGEGRGRGGGGGGGSGGVTVSHYRDSRRKGWSLLSFRRCLGGGGGVGRGGVFQSPGGGCAPREGGGGGFSWGSWGGGGGGGRTARVMWGWGGGGCGAEVVLRPDRRDYTYGGGGMSEGGEGGTRSAVARGRIGAAGWDAPLR